MDWHFEDFLTKYTPLIHHYIHRYIQRGGKINIQETENDLNYILYRIYKDNVPQDKISITFVANANMLFRRQNVIACRQTPTFIANNAEIIRLIDYSNKTIDYYV